MMKHGGNITQAAAQYGFQDAEMIDLSTGISPHPYALDLTGFSGRRWRDLPQVEDEDQLKSIMRARWSVPDSAEIALAPGSGLLINLIPRMRGAATVMMPDPVYSEHDIAWRQEGHDVQYYPAASLPHIAEDAPLLAVSVQPGNPLGNILPPEEWGQLLDHAAATDGLLVMDEAFIDLMPSHSLMPRAGQRGLIILRSLGKFYGLAGLRLGAAIGHADDINQLTAMMGPWAVSTPTLDFAKQALADDDWPDQQRQWLRHQMTQLTDMLIGAGLKMIGGTDLYCLIETKDHAATLHHQLATSGIWTRIFDHHPNWIRIGLPADDAEFQRVKDAVKASVHNSS